MKRAFLLPMLLALPLTARAGGPGDALFAAEPVLLAGEKAQPLSVTTIPLSEVRVVSLEELVRSSSSLLVPPKRAKTDKKPKKKKRLPRVSSGFFAMAAMGAGYEAPRTWGDAPLPTAPALESAPVTRAAGAAAPEPGSVALVLLALPVLGYARTRSKNA